MPLPFVDEHSIDVSAPRERTWDALVASLRPGLAGVDGPGADRFARALRARDTRATGQFPDVGSTIRGFRVDACEPPARLLLAGRHRFSEYELEFRVDALGGDRSRLTAETRAAFPGLGRIYRMLVIGLRIHVLVAKRMLNRVRAAAEATRIPGAD
jgi:hypothetical protein